MKTYYLTQAAENDLIEIVDYIASDSPAAAGKLLDRIEERFQLLAEMPESGVPREELATGLRSAAIGRYVAFYRPEREGIQVVRVLHGSRDVESILE